jgi:spermidine/putrescine-binding protein
LVGLQPWSQEKIKAIADAAKRIYGIDVSPQELLGLYDVHNPNYPELAKRVRSGMEILPGDLKHFNWFQVRNKWKVKNDD